MPITPGSWKCRDLEGSFLLLFSTNSETLVDPRLSFAWLARVEGDLSFPDSGSQGRRTNKVW